MPLCLPIAVGGLGGGGGVGEQAVHLRLGHARSPQTPGGAAAVTLRPFAGVSRTFRIRATLTWARDG